LRGGGKKKTERQRGGLKVRAGLFISPTAQTTDDFFEEIRYN